MKVLFVTAPGAPSGSDVLGDLLWREPTLVVETVVGPAAALVEIRTVGGYAALFTSPDLPHNEALALIASLRRDRTPIAIVALITDDQRAFFAPAITTGADDVLVVRDARLVAVEDTMRRVRHSRHVDHPNGHPRLRVLYAGSDELAWDILYETPFLYADRTTAGADGATSLVMAHEKCAGEPCDVLVVDEQPGNAHTLQVVKWVKSHSPETAVVVLTAPTAGDIAGAALELGADEVVGKAGTYRRRLAATLHRLFLHRLAAGAAPAAFAAEARSARVDHGPAEAFTAEPEPAIPEPAPPVVSEETLRLRDEVEFAGSRIETLTRELEIADRALGALRAERAELTDAREFDRLSRDRDRDELTALQRSLDDERAARADAEARLARAEARGETAAREAADAAEALARSEARNESLARQAAESAAALDALRADQAQLSEARDADLAGRERDRHELSALQGAVDAERGARADAEAALARAERRIETLTRDAADAAAALEALRAEHARLSDAQGFERALRERDRDELAAAQKALQEERERRIVLEGTLRATEDRAGGQIQALEAAHAAARRNLEEQLARAADRLHTIANETQVLQTRLDHQLATASAERDRLSQSALFGYALFSRAGELLQCSETFARMFGYDRAEDAMAVSAGRAFGGALDHARVVAHLDSGAPLERAESTARRADGRAFRVLTAATLRQGTGGGGAVVERIFVDVSDRVSVEAELQLARRLEAAGRLAAEMAPAIESGLPAGDDAPYFATLVRQLLAYSRRQARPAGFLSLNDAVRRVAPLLASVAGDAVSVTTRLGEVEAVAAGEDDIDHLLVELANAASGALPYGGTVTVETRPIWSSNFVLSTEIAVTAAGFGVVALSVSPSLTRTVTRCGGLTRTSGEAGRTSTLHVVLPC